jgi:hypothetical protein
MCPPSCANRVLPSARFLLTQKNHHESRPSLNAVHGNLIVIFGGSRNESVIGPRFVGLALFDLLFKEDISKTDRERVKQASRSLLAPLTLKHWLAGTGA